MTIFFITIIIGDNNTCIFAPNSPLYTESFRNAFLSVDGLITSCQDLSGYWKYLIGIMTLSFVGLVVSVLAIISDCVAPCMEEKYEKPLLRTDV